MNIMTDPKVHPERQELAQQADLLTRVLTLAKRNYTGAVEQREKDDAEAILENLEHTDISAHTPDDAS